MEQRRRWEGAKKIFDFFIEPHQPLPA